MVKGTYQAEEEVGEADFGQKVEFTSQPGREKLKGIEDNDSHVTIFVFVPAFFALQSGSAASSSE